MNKSIYEHIVKHPNLPSPSQTIFPKQGLALVFGDGYATFFILAGCLGLYWGYRAIFHKNYLDNIDDKDWRYLQKARLVGFAAISPFLIWIGLAMSLESFSFEQHALPLLLLAIGLVSLIAVTYINNRTPKLTQSATVLLGIGILSLITALLMSI